MKDKNVKQVLLGGGYWWGVVNGKGEGRGICLVHTICLYKNRALNPVEVVLNRGKRLG
jgi:hypothetical protein